MSGPVRVAVSNGGTGGFITNVPRRQQVRWLNELNGVGSGQFTMHLDDEILDAYPNLLDAGNIVRFYVGETCVTAWVIEEVLPSELDEGAQRLVDVMGRGAAASLDNACLYPEYGLYRVSSDERHFTFASKLGAWYVTPEWVDPAFKRQGDDDSVRAKLPKEWIDPDAYWLWVTNPQVSADPGFNWFRATFNVPVGGAIVGIYASADNTFRLFLDGDEIIATNEGTRANFATMFSHTVVLEEGAHLLAAEVENLSSPGNPTNPGGFLCSVWTQDSGGKRLTRIKRTSEIPGDWKVKGYGDPPGWFAAQVLRTVLDEAQARSVRLNGLKWTTWSDTADSGGTAWTGRRDASFRIGTTSALDMLGALSETGFDWEVRPTDLELRLFSRKGTDRRATVRILPTRDLTDYQASISYGALKNRVLVRYKHGWATVNVPSSESKYGRRETAIIDGGAESHKAAVELAASLLEDTEAPMTTVTVQVSSAQGPQPYVDFVLGDTVTSLAPLRGLQPGRVMAITGAEEEDAVAFTIDLFPEV